MLYFVAVLGCAGFVVVKHCVAVLCCAELYDAAGLWCVLLDCAVLSCVVLLCHVVLWCYAVLCCDELCCVVLLYYVVLCCVAALCSTRSRHLARQAHLSQACDAVTDQWWKSLEVMPPPEQGL